MSAIKTAAQIQTMKVAGKILGEILASLKSHTKPGKLVLELEDEFISLCDKFKVTPTCKGYSEYGLKPFPTGLCVSINSQAVHCPPKKDVIITDTDIVTVDTVIGYNGLHVDSSFCIAMPGSTTTRKNMAVTAEKAFDEAVSRVREGIKTGLLGSKIYSTAKIGGFNVLRDFAGHGIGEEMHEWPDITCFGTKNEGVKLKAGMTICIETLICEGNPKVETKDGWETNMADGKDFCQHEHTVLVTRNGYEILTQ
ncbi:type I methionyl aminopeptidase [candidate division WWE3 bacterium RIFOXYC1_FULL_40_10]|uniref:Methionine aminopeptidase n=1 Tax=candidate division WWE3 bacterium RIFOXYA2_FULL_46_9 TaxID=1802636 RepID=A0A1F4W1Q8_UNCKA|nr:MAG: type I methionyl aminopeptidase [candidate division WWE3 bacterium RIFOXYB1_FULL_40_22]OGC61674.1 MAG: type I methionyl aminopeptidase [candidate division WWE3 bacterium RIFOXYA1_FULL_40_11]OGC63300.1 MAG: type I methionyl aminopeptidase [candidate division WWE3 bacterium RIFOXYA2_FULL_46_9]OGC64850.1 MAG: type I methionyl aminopeptidase [candidate division WWE3 bacterium RIFOXYB2_FULL_41_6]OGC66057.1 MAG: type I methionyl aminopeptidase [candidate division WWE3 bacterium RIFOXYC1_FULL_